MYDILQLNDMLVPELKEIANQLGIKGYHKLTKQDIVYKILDEQALAEKKTGGEKVPVVEEPAPGRKIVVRTEQPAPKERSANPSDASKRLRKPQKNTGQPKPATPTPIREAEPAERRQPDSEREERQPQNRDFRDRNQPSRDRDQPNRDRDQPSRDRDQPNRDQPNRDRRDDRERRDFRDRNQPNRDRRDDRDRRDFRDRNQPNRPGNPNLVDPDATKLSTAEEEDFIVTPLKEIRCRTRTARSGHRRPRGKAPSK
jgi:transcription termination factor Rho